MKKRRSAKERFAGELLESIVTPKVNIVNEAAASDSEIETMLENRIKNINNSCRGNIARALTNNPEMQLLGNASSITRSLLSLK